MKKELLLSGLACFILVGSVSIMVWDNTNEVENASINLDVNKSNQRVQPVELLPVNRWGPTVGVRSTPSPRGKTRAHNEQVLESSEQKIHSLMLEFDKNLSNVANRARIEKQLKEVSLDYKEEVLLKVQMLNVASK